VFGDTFIKPKKQYNYYINYAQKGQWYIDAKVPVKFNTYIDNNGNNAISVQWE
jgi:hypothetical protein